MRWPVWWLRFTEWTKTRPWAYRTIVGLSLPTVLPVCTLVGLVSGVMGGFVALGHGVRSFVAGKPT